MSALFIDADACPVTRDAIDMRLLIRHEERKVRRSGGRTKGPDPFSDDDRERFRRNLSRMMVEAI